MLSQKSTQSGVDLWKVCQIQIYPKIWTILPLNNLFMSILGQFHVNFLSILCQKDFTKLQKYTIYTAHTAHTVDTVDIAYTVDTVDTAFTIQTALHCLNRKVRTLLEWADV